MIGELLTPDLIRAWENYFRQKGGTTPRAGHDVMPVVVMDSSPYGAARQWQFGTTQAASVGNFSLCGIQNGSEKTSLCVVDWIIVRCLVAMDVVTFLTNSSILAITGQRSPADVMQEKDQGPTDRGLVGNLTGGVAVNAGSFSSDIIPIGDTLPRRIDGPWTLGPTENFYVEGQTANAGLAVYFRGRYYPAA